ncbi:MAG: PAS domain S-box protein [Thermoanaerobaculia bacterium]
MADSGFPDAGRLAQAAIEALTTHVCIVDREGRIVAANRAWREFTRENCAEPSLVAPGTPYESVMRAMAGEPPSNTDTFIFALREVLAGKRQSATIDHRRDGGLVPIHFRTHVTPLDLGESRAALISHEDLTGIDEASRALSNSRTEFEALVDGVDGIVWEADACTTYFTFVSQRAESLLGYPREAWYTGGFWASHIYEPDRAEAVAYCAEATKRLENHAFEYRMVARDGRLVWIRDIVTVVARDGRPDVLRGVLFDVTAIREAAQALRESELRFRITFEQAAVGMCIADERGDYLRVNHKFAEILGYEEQALVGTSFRKLTHPADLETNIALFASLQRGEVQSLSFEKHFVRKDGTPVPVHLTISGFQAADDPQARYIGVIEDVTERVKALEGLRRFRAALDTSADAILLVDRETMKIVDANEPAEAMTGLTRERLLASEPQQLLAGVDRPLLERRFDEILDSGERAVMQANVRRPDGRTFPGELHLSTLRDERALIVASLRDVSDRLAVEESHRERERLFSALFENNNAIKLILDPVTGRIIDANPAAAEFYGYPRERLLRMSIHDINPAPVDEVRAAMESAKTRKESHFEVRHRLASGEIREMEIYSGPVALAGKRLLFSILHDVTERKRAEADARRHRDLLEAQNSVLKRIASDEPFDSILKAIVEVIERAAPGAVCSILLVGDDGVTLRPGSAPGLPDEYNRAVDGSQIGEGGSPCAAAAHRRELVIVEDIQTDPLWAQSRELASRCGLASCWSNPILSNAGSLLGTFAIYYRQRRTPSPAEIEVIELATSLARIAIERRHAVGALRHAEEHIRQVFAASPLPIFELDLDGHFRMWNAAAERVFGWTSDDLAAAPNRIVDESNLEQFAELRDRVLRGELIIDARVRRQRRDGSVIPLTLHVAPLVDETGKVTGLIAVTDVVSDEREG